MKNTTVYNRAAKDSQNTYTKISSFLINDDRLSAAELGILIKILKNNDNYVFNKNYVQKQSKIGRDQFNKCIQHLKELGYLASKKIQSGCAWTVNEISTIKNPLTENQCVEKFSTSTEIRMSEKSVTEVQYNNYFAQS